jgi:hypothetical protein
MESYLTDSQDLLLLRNEGISVLQVMQAEDLDTLFILPLSAEALEELDLLQEQLADTAYAQDDIDRWTPIWGNRYTSRQF